MQIFSYLNRLHYDIEKVRMSITVAIGVLLIGVLFDAFIVRMMIVPTLMLLMGKAAWYMAKWLDKILPNVDIEGETIMSEIEKEKEQKY